MRRKSWKVSKGKHQKYAIFISPWLTPDFEWRLNPSTKDKEPTWELGCHFIYGSSLTKFNGGVEHSTCLHDITFITSRTQFKSPPHLGNQENMPSIQDKRPHSKWGLFLHKYEILPSNQLAYKIKTWQAKVKRIQYHQTSFKTNFKGTYIVKKYKKRKKIYKINPKQLRKWQ